MSKHTPGPWAVTHEEQRRTIFGVVGPLGKGEATFIAKIPRPADGNDMQSLATARLIAAAPDMFEALMDAHATIKGLVWSGTGDEEGAMTAQLAEIEAAIIKATGAV